MKRLKLWMCLALFVGGCAAEELDLTSADRGVDGKPVFQSCTDAPLPAAGPTVRWRHWWNYLVAAAEAGHSAQDVLAVPGQAAVVPGKFAYGIFSKDLEGEWIEISIDDCAGGYALLGYARTNGDGRVDLPLTELPAVGEYNLYLRVMGDNTAARSVLRVYPEGTKFVVFDIDATLTQSDLEVVGQVVVDIFNGDYVPQARAGALEVTEARHYGQNYEIIYLTARSYLLTEVTREWLSELGFPRGTLHVNDRVEDVLWPGANADYKANYLASVTARGYQLEAAYGNAATDIEAYERAQIPKEQTFIVGERGGTSGTVDLGENYWEHIEALAGEPAIEQPFE